MIDSAKRKKVDLYDIQYEQVPHFCFSCGRLGHSDIMCPTPDPRDEKGNLPFGPKLRAPEQRGKATSADNSSHEQDTEPSSHRESKNSSNAGKGEEVTSPAKERANIKRKGAPKQVYRRVEHPPLMLTDGVVPGNIDHTQDEGADASTLEDGQELEWESKKKKPTPENSAETAGQSCPSQ